MLRLGASEKSLTELVAVGSHVAGVSLGAAGLQLEPEPQASEATDAASTEEADANDLDGEIRSWARQHLDLGDVPSYWRVLRSQRKFRAAHWQTHRLVLSDGEIDARAKGLIALAVASFKASTYWVTYFKRYCRTTFGASEGELQEAILAAMHSVSANTVAHGMMLDARYHDMRAEDFRDETP